MDITVGTCSCCGGRVTIPGDWMATVPPVPKCQQCGATKKQPHGDVIEMEPAKQLNPLELGKASFERWGKNHS